MQVLPDGPKGDALAAAKAAGVTPMPELLSATAAQHHVDMAERRKGNRSAE